MRRGEGTGTRKWDQPKPRPAQAAWHLLGEPKVDPKVDPCTWSPETQLYAHEAGERGLEQPGPSKPRKDFWKMP